MAKQNEVVKEDDDKTQKIFGIILVLLVIISLVVLFIVGCDRKEPEEEKKEPDKQEVIDNKKEDITLDTNTTHNNLVQKTNNETTKEDEEETNYYNVIYYFYEINATDEPKLVGTSSKKVKEGSIVEKTTIEGYEDFEYYLDKNFTAALADRVVDGDIIVYVKATCAKEKLIIEYVVDDEENPITNTMTINVGDEFYSKLPTEVTKKDGEVVFVIRWKLGRDLSAPIVTEDTDLAEYATDGKVTIYAETKEEITVNYVYNGENVENDEIQPDNTYTVVATSKMKQKINVNDRVLGYSLTEGGIINYVDGDKLTADNATEGTIILYVVVGTTTVTYITATDTQTTVGYTQEKLENWTVPTPEEIGVYAVGTATEAKPTAANTVLVVGNDTEDVAMADRMIRLDALKELVFVSPELEQTILEGIADKGYYEMELNTVEPTSWVVTGVEPTDTTEITVGDELVIGEETTLPAGVDIIVEIVIPEPEEVEEDNDSTEVADNGEAEEPTVPEEA